MGLTFILRAHNLSVVNHFVDEIVVIHLGQLIEKAPMEELFDHPIPPYARALLSAIPISKVGIERPKRNLFRGEISSPIDPPAAGSLIVRVGKSRNKGLAEENRFLLK